MCMCVCMRDASKVSEKGSVNVFSPRAKMSSQVSQDRGRKQAIVSLTVLQVKFILSQM